MSNVNRYRFAGLAAFLILAGLTLPASGRAQNSSRPHAQGRLARAAEKTLKEGNSAKLPPHISTLLGIAKDEECPVKQNALRTGNLVQGFDVSVNNKNDIVLFVVDESANDQSLYLTSPEGVLRKVVAVKAGVGNEVRVTDKNIIAFKKEKAFWLDRLAPTDAVK